ncbi:MAG: DUF1329 domain-containing protein [Pseudomonadota bacterium]
MRIRTAAVALALLAAVCSVQAKVTPEEAARLKTDLTPTGAERAANAAGTIPAWDGGLTKSPPCYKGEGTWYCDPFPEDKPLFTITKENLDTHKDKLTPGQIAMFSRYPTTYKMKVYATRRTHAYPDWVNEATYQNALKGELAGGGESMKNVVVGIPVPIPKAGAELIWNHKLRYRGSGATRWNMQAAVTTSGEYNAVKIREDVEFAYGQKTATPENLKNVAIYFLQQVHAPPRLAGIITLVHETMDQVAEPRRAWQYNPGQRRLRRAPNIGYDNPGTGSDGLRTNDQLDMFNGALDRYTWQLVGKKELYIPYNAYALHSNALKYPDIFKKNHINAELPRYELHRVWVVDSTTRPGKNHAYKRRTFYIDEDAWQMAVVDIYDNRDQLWRVQEAHPIVAYDKPFMVSAGETVYDLYSNRYLAMSFNNEEAELVEVQLDRSMFDPSNVSKLTTK